MIAPRRWPRHVEPVAMRRVGKKGTAAPTARFLWYGIVSTTRYLRNPPLLGILTSPLARTRGWAGQSAGPCITAP